MPLKQQPLSAAIDEALHQHLLSTAPSIRARALALSSALPHAGNWLNGIPSSTLGLHLQDQEFRCCLLYWLGVPLHSSPYSCPECHNTADPFGDHQLSYSRMYVTMYERCIHCHLPRSGYWTGPLVHSGLLDRSGGGIIARKEGEPGYEATHTDVFVFHI